MIVAWVLLASVGMYIARYFKFIFPKQMVNGLMIWFFLHRPLMILTYILTLVSLIVILVEKDWRWISQSNPTAFVHSIFGLVLIGLSTLQVYFLIINELLLM